MKKLLGLCIALLLCVTGCGKDLMNTPTKKAEMFLSSYQTLDEKVLDELDDVVAEEELFNTKQRDLYRTLMKKHYQGLVYAIKDETIDGDKATVTVEITVMDYSKIMRDAEDYRDANRDKFNDETGKYSESLFIDYRLSKMKEAKDKVKYTLELPFTKKDNVWKMDTLSDIDYAKIHGIYSY